MDIKKHREIIKNIIDNLGNQALVSEQLTTLAEDNEHLENNLTELTKNNESLVSDNEALRKANNRLFVRLGAEIDEQEKEEKKAVEPEKDEKLTFEGLFNEKGELK